MRIYFVSLAFAIVIFILPGSLSGLFAQNANPYISIAANPSVVGIGQNSTVNVVSGNAGADAIASNSLEITITAGSNAEIIGLAAGSDSRWTVISLTAGSGGTIKLRNTGAGSFGTFNLGTINITIKGVAVGGPELIFANISYLPGLNPNPAVGPNASQGNATLNDDNSASSLTVTSTPCSGGVSYFQKQYGGPQNEVGAGIAITNDLGYIIVGYTTSWGNGGWDATLQKVNRHGQIVWSRSIGGLREDRLYTVRRSGDGNFIATGFTKSFQNSDGEAWLVKFDESGNIIWTKTYGDGGIGEWAHDVIPLSDGGYCLVGGYNFAPGTSESMVIRVDNLGNIIWRNVYPQSNTDAAHGVTEDGNSLLISGYYYGSSFYEGYLMKIDKSTGAVQWTRGYDADPGRTNSMYRTTKTSSGYQVWALAYDDWLGTNQQQVIWNLDFNGQVINVLKMVVPGTQTSSFGSLSNSDGGFIVANGVNNAEADVIFTKVGPSGNIEWSKKYARPGFQAIHKIIGTPDLGFTGIGETGAGSTDSYLVTIDNNGNGGSCSGTNTNEVSVTTPSFSFVTRTIYSASRLITATDFPGIPVSFTPTTQIHCSDCEPVNPCEKPTISYLHTPGGQVQTINNGLVDPSEAITVSLCDGQSYVLSNMVHSNPSAQYKFDVTTTSGGVIRFNGIRAENLNLSAAQVSSLLNWTVTLDQPNFGGTVVMTVTPYADLNNSYSLDAGDCPGDPYTITYTVTPKLTWYRDQDGDGYASQMINSCSQPSGNGWTNTVLPLGDCNDLDHTINPGAQDICDGIDKNCDGVVETLYPQLSFNMNPGGMFITGDDNHIINLCDGETFQMTNISQSPYSRQEIMFFDNGGLSGNIRFNNQVPTNQNLTKEEFELYYNNIVFTASLANPTASSSIIMRIYPFIDLNNNGLKDEYIDCHRNVIYLVFNIQPKPVWYRDIDGDGFSSATQTSCQMPSGQGWTSNPKQPGDCDDNNNTIYPGAPELCDGLDNDCNGIIETGAPYVILAQEEVYMHKNVVNGNVGVWGAGKSAKFKEYTTVNGSVRASIINTDATSTITGTRTNSPATAPDPNSFKYNRKPDPTTDIVVPANAIDYPLNGTNFRKITISKNASVRFYGTDSIYIKELIAADADAGKTNTIKFTGNTVLLIRYKMDLGKRTILNPDNYRVTIFEEQNNVAIGGSSQINANIDCRFKYLLTEEALESAHTSMNGTYIAKKVDSKRWVDWFGGCATPVTPFMGQQNHIVATDEIVTDEFIVKASPNPSQSDFRIDIKTMSDLPVSIRLFDVSGKTIRVISNHRPGYPAWLGSDLIPGVYMAEVSQGVQRKLIKLIKM